MIINDKHKFIFVHIQKTAGTSITDALFKIPETYQLNHSHSMLNTINIEDYKDYFKFCFVRNPFDRLFSWYNMILQKGFHNEWSNYILKNSTSFSEFLNLQDVILEKNPLELQSSIDYPKSIIFNQLDYIKDSLGNIRCDFIGRFENIENDFNHISNRLQIETHLSHLNKFSHKSYKDYYSEIDVKKVEELYKHDIDYFQYKF
jgi:chondroitin 4-sulfotransferase 11